MRHVSLLGVGPGLAPELSRPLEVPDKGVVRLTRSQARFQQVSDRYLEAVTTDSPTLSADRVRLSSLRGVQSLTLEPAPKPTGYRSVALSIQRARAPLATHIARLRSGAMQLRPANFQARSQPWRCPPTPQALQRQYASVRLASAT